jgi:hypothetical protein
MAVMAKILPRANVVPISAPVISSVPTPPTVCVGQNIDIDFANIIHCQPQFKTGILTEEPLQELAVFCPME